MNVVQVTFNLKFTELNGGTYEVYNREGRVVGRVAKRLVELFEAGELEDEIDKMQRWTIAIRRMSKEVSRANSRVKRASLVDPWRKKIRSMQRALRLRVVPDTTTMQLTSFKTDDWRLAFNRMKTKANYKFKEKQFDEWDRWTRSVCSNGRKRQNRKDYNAGT